MADPYSDTLGLLGGYDNPADLQRAQTMASALRGDRERAMFAAGTGLPGISDLGKARLNDVQNQFQTLAQLPGMRLKNAMGQEELKQTQAANQARLDPRYGNAMTAFLASMDPELARAAQGAPPAVLEHLAGIAEKKYGVDQNAFMRAWMFQQQLPYRQAGLESVHMMPDGSWMTYNKATHQWSPTQAPAAPMPPLGPQDNLGVHPVPPPGLAAPGGAAPGPGGAAPAPGAPGGAPAPAPGQPPSAPQTFTTPKQAGPADIKDLEGFNTALRRLDALEGLYNKIPKGTYRGARAAHEAALALHLPADPNFADLMTTAGSHLLAGMKADIGSRVDNYQMKYGKDIFPTEDTPHDIAIAQINRLRQLVTADKQAHMEGMNARHLDMSRVPDWHPAQAQAPAAPGPAAPQAPAGAKIRVRRKSDGATGSLNPAEFDPSRYERI